MGRASNLGSRALVDLRPGKAAFPALRGACRGREIALYIVSFVLVGGRCVSQYVVVLFFVVIRR